MKIKYKIDEFLWEYCYYDGIVSFGTYKEFASDLNKEEADIVIRLLNRQQFYQIIIES